MTVALAGLRLHLLVQGSLQGDADDVEAPSSEQ